MKLPDHRKGCTGNVTHWYKMSFILGEGVIGVMRLAKQTRRNIAGPISPAIDRSYPDDRHEARPL